MELENVNIGNRIKEVQQIKGISKAELSRVLNMNQSNLDKLLNKFSIKTSKLVEISKALKYNFFKDFCVEDGTYHDIFRNEEGLEINFEIIDVNIGALIEKRMKELCLTQKEVANKLNLAFGLLNIKQQNISVIVKKNTIDTELLVFISSVLQYNFFKEFYYNLSGIEHKNKYNMETRTTDLLKRLVLFHGAKPEVEAIQEYARVIEKEIRKSICDEIMKNVTEKVTEKANENATDKLLDSKLFEFALTVRTLNILKLNEIDTVRDLVSLTPTDFHRLRSIGPKAFTELDVFLKSHNLKWGMNV